MDLVANHEGLTAGALALAAGEHARAAEHYERLEAAYSRHQHHAGLAAIRFNNAIAALESRNRSQIPRRLSALAETLRTGPGGCAWTLEVARRVCELFREPLPGVDELLTADLVAAAAARLEPRETAEGAPLAVHEIPTPDALAELGPADALLAVLRLAQATRSSAGAPGWLCAVRSDVLGDALAGDERMPPIESATDRVSEDRYPGLVDALRDAVQLDPLSAAELVVGLEQMEREGLPELVRFHQMLPCEQRLFSSIELHGSVAAALSREAGAERLALRQWARVRELAAEWTEHVESRARTSRRRAADVGARAAVSVWHARAARALGDLTSAAEILESSVVVARRSALDEPAIVTRVFFEHAEISERRGERSLALDGYLRTIGALGVDLADPVTISRGGWAEIADGLRSDGDATRAIHFALSLAGLARVDTKENARSRVDAARLVLAAVRVLMEPALFARVLLIVELSGAHIGEPGAAARALVAALSSAHHGAAALAQLYRAREAEASESDGRQEALSRFIDAARLAQFASTDAVRRAIEFEAASALHRLGEARSERMTIQLRRLATAMRPASVPDGGGALEYLLPEGARVSAATVLDRFIIWGVDPGLSRRVAAGERVRGGERAPITTEASEALRSAHLRLFERRWISGEAGDAPLGVDLGALSAPSAPDLAPLVSEESHARLEFWVGPSWSLGLLATSTGTYAHRWGWGEARWAAEIDRMLASLVTAGGVDSGTPEHLFDAVLRPFVDHLNGVSHLAVVPHGPLLHLPFAALCAPGAHLAYAVDLAVSWPGVSRLEDTNGGPTSPLRWSDGHGEWLMGEGIGPDGIEPDEVEPMPDEIDLEDGDEPAERVLIRLIGDAIYGTDLAVSELNGVPVGSAGTGCLTPEHIAVDTRGGGELEPAALEACFGGVRVAILYGPMNDGRIAFAEDEQDGAPISARAVAEGMSRCGVSTAILMDPAALSERVESLEVLLDGVRAGLVVRRWSGDEDRRYLMLLSRHVAEATDAEGLVRAVGHARREAIDLGLAVADWAGYEVLVRDP